MTVTIEAPWSLADLEGKDVILALSNDRGDIEGYVVKANVGAVVLKSGNRTEIYERSEILDFEVVDKSKPKKVMVRYIAEPTHDKIRQHLADRHAVPVDLIPKSPEEAMEMHSKINHDQRNLGHRHGEKPKRRRRAPADTGAVAERAALLEAADETEVEYGDDSDFNEEE